MSRWTLGNVVRVGAVVVFLPLLAFLVLVIGGVRKNVRASLEGLLYAGAFSTALFLPDFWGPPALLAVAAMGASGVRSWHLRDLWLPARRRWWKRDTTESARVVEQASPPQPDAVEGPEGLRSALAWVRRRADENRHRLPGDTHETVLRTAQVLEAVVAAEQRKPSADPRLEYELEAMARRYLPAVLGGYLAIAPGRAHERQPNGLTPDEELAQQLRILSAQAEGLYASRHRRLTAELSTTGNFLRDKYGHQQPEGSHLRVP